MSRLYDWLLNALYITLLTAAGPWIVWSAVRQGKHRAGYREKLLGWAPRRSDDGCCVWMHAVSVGEVNLLEAAIRELTSRRADLTIVISTTTKSGFELAKQKYAQHSVFYCPLDFSWAVDAAMHRVRPDALLLMELELWPNLIRAAKRHGVKVAVVNGRLSDHSFRGYRRIRRFVAPLMERIDLIAAQDASVAERFCALGGSPAATLVTGSLKFDGAVADRNNPETDRLRRLAQIVVDDPIFLAGSTQSAEEEMSLNVYGRLLAQHPRLRLIVVPRHPERFDEVAGLIERSGHAWTRRTALDNGSPADWRVLLVDTIGELGAWWGLATIGLVGGTFGDRGGQNMLEPAAYGVATCFGPNTWNFRDIVGRLLADRAAVVVHDQEELLALVERCLSDEAYRRELGRRASRCVASHQGAAARTAEVLCGLLPRPYRTSREVPASGNTQRVA